MVSLAILDLALDTASEFTVLMGSGVFVDSSELPEAVPQLDFKLPTFASIEPHATKPFHPRREVRTG